MSAQAEKVLRRDLRRAVGAEAIGVIDHNAQLLAAVQRHVADIDQRVIVLEQRAKARDAVLERYRSRLDALELELEQRTLKSRLRWFFTGWLTFGGAK